MTQIDIVGLLEKKRGQAIREANELAHRLAQLPLDIPVACRMSLELVERMYSHNVQIMDDALRNIEVYSHG